MSSTSEPPTKRRRGEHGAIPAFGAPSDVDREFLLPHDYSSPSSSSLSTRTLFTRPDTLASICLRIFAVHLPELYAQPATARWLQLLPDQVVPKLLTLLREIHPGRLSHGLIVNHLLRGDRVILTDALPGVGRNTIQSVASCGDKLRHLELTGFSSIDDKVFASVIQKSPALEQLSLRGCSKVSRLTVDAITKTCKSLISLNLGFTSTPVSSLANLIRSCDRLEVLKIAGIHHVKDTLFAKELTGLFAHVDGGAQLLPRLHTLKLRHLALSDHSVATILKNLPSLRNIDLSFMPIRTPGVDPSLSLGNITKLALTSTPVQAKDLVGLLMELSSLKILHIGALGATPPSSTSQTGLGTSGVMRSATLTLTDEVLSLMTAPLSEMRHLEVVNLAGNAKLGASRLRTMPSFIQQVGRKLKILNLGGLTALKSTDLASLKPQDGLDEPPSRLETLVLSNTPVGDDAAPFIASCTALYSLEISNTKFTNPGVFEIIDSCPVLQQIDLTACRGVGVRDRRHFFEAWEESRR